MLRTLVRSVFLFLSAGLAVAATAPSSVELRFRTAARAHVAGELEAGRVADLGLRALDALFAKAHAALRARGFNADADELEAEWIGVYRERFADDARLSDQGDHAPASEFIAKWYAAVEAKLGLTICEFFHFRDVFTINQAWPVVTEPHFDSFWCAETLELNPEDRCKKEYGRHFTGTKWQIEEDPFARPVKTYGLAPVAAYWVTFAACEAALWGSDGTFLCGPAATAVEIGTARFIAPPVSDRIWDHFNP